MLKSILLALDESPSSQSAKKLGLSLARHYKAALAGIGVVDSPWISAPEAIPLGGGAFKVELDAKRLQEAKHRVHALEKSFRAECTNEGIECSIIDVMGSPAYEIESFVTQYDLLIVGKDVNFRFSEPPDTTVLVNQILKDNPRPVIVTGPHIPSQEKSSVLVAFDGTFAASRALHMALLIDMFKGKVVHIASVDTDEKKVHGHVNAAAKLCENHGVKAHIHPLVSTEKPATVLLELMEDLTPSLLVIGAFGHGGFHYFLMGSCAQDLLKSADVPIFIYH